MKKLDDPNKVNPNGIGIGLSAWRMFCQLLGG